MEIHILKYKRHIKVSPKCNFNKIICFIGFLYFNWFFIFGVQTKQTSFHTDTQYYLNLPGYLPLVCVNNMIEYPHTKKIRNSHHNGLFKNLTAILWLYQHHLIVYIEPELDVPNRMTRANQ